MRTGILGRDPGVSNLLGTLFVHEGDLVDDDGIAEWSETVTYTIKVVQSLMTMSAVGAIATTIDNNKTTIDAH